MNAAAMHRTLPSRDMSDGTKTNIYKIEIACSNTYSRSFSQNELVHMMIEIKQYHEYFVTQ